MNITQECVACIINQSVRVSSAIGADAQLSLKIQNSIERMSQNFSYAQTPPQIAADVYASMAKLAKMDDLYAKEKHNASKNAGSYIPFLKKKILNSPNKLLSATKIAVAGNVIDLASKESFSLKAEVEGVFEREFAKDDVKKLESSLQNARSVLVIGDNVGEHLFDYLFIETLQGLYENIHFYYMVRGEPIINDVTMKEAREAGFHKLCSLIDSGVNTPGFSYERANAYSQKLFDSCDVVISKGMGNYECLTPIKRKNICFLLKVKCNVVARSLEKNVGDMICQYMD